MTERYGNDPYGRQPRLLGYDDYGRPVYEEQPQQPSQPQPPQQPPPPQGGPGAAGEPYPGGHDPYAPQPGYGSYPGGYDPYAAQAQQGGPGHYDGQHDPYAAPSGQYGAQYGAEYGRPGVQQDYGHDPYGPQDFQPQQPQHQPQQSPQAPPQVQQQPQEWIPPQSRTSPEVDAATTRPRTQPEAEAARAEEGYSAEQFAFLEEPSDASEDVIDWLKFSESRTERREEAKRRGRNRKVALVVVLVLAVLGGSGWAWYADKLPWLDSGSGGSTPAAGEQRDVIVVHLRSTKDGSSSTALLVDNASEQRGSTVLLPNSLAVSAEDGTTTTLAKSVEDEGASPTREGLDNLLGADIKGTWRLDTPYLENLVKMVGDITVDADATVPAAKEGEDPLVRRGKAQELDGQAAVAYATHRAPGEPQTKQLARFGEVMQQTLRKVSSDPDAATRTVESLGQVPDPSLSEAQLGASLAKLAEQAKNGSYKTQLLPVLGNGTLSRGTSEGLVKDVLGGTVKNSDPGAALRVQVSNASGDRSADDAASVALVNGGYTVVDGGAGGTARARSLVTYGDAGQKAKAAEVATTLGLPGTAVRKGESAANADVTVVLGSDYKG